MILRLIFFAFLFINCSANTYAHHVAGGELFYKYLGRGSGNNNRYLFTLRLFRECSSNGLPLLEQKVNIGIYDNADLSLFKSETLALTGPPKQIAFTPSSIPCLVNDVDICYELAEYTDTLDLGITGFGYTAAWFACCRADSIHNILDTLAGLTYIAKMPGSVHNASRNSSSSFVVKDTVVVCAGKPFSIDFSAQDADGDELFYEFEAAYGAARNLDGSIVPPKMYLSSLEYKLPNTGGSPMGDGVKIGVQTGLISGTAPPLAGSYVLNVTVIEARNGIPIASHNKDFLIKVKNCVILEADLKPSYSGCKDLTFAFKNESPNPLIESYLWDFGAGGNTSTLAAPTFTYPDTGTYKVRLIVTGAAGCVDTSFTNIHVYPAFVPGFTVSKACQDSVVQFKDITSTTYGTINSYKWNFGDTIVANDTSNLKDPAYHYGDTSGLRDVKLIVTSSKGCIDSISKPVIIQSAVIDVAFSDTTICKTDTLQLSVNGPGNYSWSPAYNMLNGSSASPLVYPSRSFTYYVASTNADCITRDSVNIKVLDFITAETNHDTTICLLDSMRLQVASEGNNFTWYPTAGVDDPSSRSPMISPATDTKYFVTARLGHCVSVDSITIKVAVPPMANAGEDTTICFGEFALLNASVYGAPFAWSNTSSLQEPGSLNTIATPQRTTRYVLNVLGAPGCPKTAHDTVFVNVIQPLNVFAGNDTMILEGEPLQLQPTSTSTANYKWQPATGLNNPDLPNPVLLINAPTGPLTYKVQATTAQGCTSEDEIKITVFKKGADIYVPSAFTPNADGVNDKIRAIPVGVVQFNFFRIFNRYGQLLFETTDQQKGWDGKLNSINQPAGVYVYSTTGVDITGRLISKKSTFVLIR